MAGKTDFWGLVSSATTLESFSRKKQVSVVSVFRHTDVILQKAVTRVDAEVEIAWRCWNAIPPQLREIWPALTGLPTEFQRERFRGDIRCAEEVLGAYLFGVLGASDSEIRRKRGEPPFQLLYRSGFRRLSASDIEVVAALMRLGDTLPHMSKISAVACLALWRFGDESLHLEALRALEHRTLPRDPHWLYEVVRVFGSWRIERDLPDSRKLLTLARYLVEIGRADKVSWIVGLYFVRRYDSWWTGDVFPNLVGACDRAAVDDSPQNRLWFDLAADAAIEGELTHTWLEPLVAAAIRFSTEKSRERKLREFHACRTYDVGSQRLSRLHEADLREVRAGNTRIRHTLVHHAFDLRATNPNRAMLLLELIITADYGMGLRAIIEHPNTQEDPRIHALLALYVLNMSLSELALKGVKSHSAIVDWPHFGVRHVDLQTYLLVAQYEEPFHNRLIHYQGVEIEHCDKDAAAFVHYFRTKRLSPGTVTRWIDDLDLPDWIAVRVSEKPVVDAFFGTMMHAFERAARIRRRPVLKVFQKAGTPIFLKEDIARLSARTTSKVAWRARHHALALAVVAGGAAGGMGPKTMGISAILDTPLVMALTAEICAAACDFYGFEPSEHPDLPRIILAVALMGSHPTSYDASQVYHQYHRFMLRKSLLLAASSHGEFRNFVAPIVATAVDRIFGAGKTWRDRVSLFSNAPQARLRQLSKGKRDLILPATEAAAGALLNLAFVYDLTEAAQAVLLDRFLARKYPAWKGTW